MLKQNINFLSDWTAYFSFKYLFPPSVTSFEIQTFEFPFLSLFHLIYHCAHEWNVSAEKKSSDGFSLTQEESTEYK